MNNIDEIMQQLLAAIQDNPEFSIEEVAKSVAQKSGFTDEEILELEGSFKALDNINIKAQELEAARKKGITRDGWIKKELTDIADSAGLNGGEILSEIENGSGIGLNNTLTQEM
ncbi:MAG: hypothetical protein K2K97_00935 [Muribaculaceae bacterium]|nr:hypothetical protein [Muribaculaceae bacterium]